MASRQQSTAVEPAALPFPSSVGKPRRLTAINGTVRHFNVVEEIAREQPGVENGTRKVIYFQRIVFKDTGQEEYRFTYYMLGLKPGARGRWVFGQYSLLIPGPLLAELLCEARRLGWKYV